jgi:hypothetical protein
MHRSRPEAQAEHVGLEPRTGTDRAADEEAEDGMSDEPVEPMAPLAESAVGIHEMFESFVEGGFTREEAIQLIAEIVVRQGRP